MNSTATKRPVSKQQLVKAIDARVREGRDVWMIIEFPDGQRHGTRMSRSFYEEWDRALGSGLFVGGERVRVGTAEAIVLGLSRPWEGDDVRDIPIDWIGYRVAPHVEYAEEAQG